MARRRDLSPDEAKLWHRVAKTTKPIAPRRAGPNIILPPIELVSPMPAPQEPELPHVALKRAKAARAVIKPQSPPTRIKPSCTLLADASGHKKVRRGKLDIDARIDLHGMRQIEAQSALVSIITRVRANNGRCLLVVTGKGAPIDPGEDFITPQPGVIRRRLPEWLNGAGIREHVSGFSPAHAKDGGSGAFYVLLKRRSQHT